MRFFNNKTGFIKKPCSGRFIEMIKLGNFEASLWIYKDIIAIGASDEKVKYFNICNIHYILLQALLLLNKISVLW